MIHEIDATAGEITRTWDTGSYWINHQAYENASDWDFDEE